MLKLEGIDNAECLPDDRKTEVYAKEISEKFVKLMVDLSLPSDTIQADTKM